MTILPNNCTCSELKVFPPNWNTRDADVSLTWYIHYRFYDPAYSSDPKIKGVKLKIIKGMNTVNSLREKQEVTKALLEAEKDLLLNQCYNPITGKFSRYAIDLLASEFSISCRASSKAGVETFLKPSSFVANNSPPSSEKETAGKLG